MTTTNRTIPSIRVRMVLAAAMASAALAGAASCQARPDPVDLKIVDRDTGRVLRVWPHHGRMFVAGRPGDRYSLRVTNHTDGRVLVVMSVDGVNVISGETAGYDQRGYVFDPHETYDVTGWRKSDSEVAAFTFAPLPQSYAARTGRPADVGVIGMAVFNEKVYVPPPEPAVSEDRWRGLDEPRGGYPAAARGAAAPPPAPLALPAPPPSASSGVAAARRAAPSAKALSAGADFARLERRDEKLGTAHGAREWSEVATVDFERATAHPQFTRQIEYDTYAHLVAAGVIRPYAYPQPHPRPFPSDPDGAGYAPDPPDQP